MVFVVTRVDDGTAAAADGDDTAVAFDITGLVLVGVF